MQALEKWSSVSAVQLKWSLDGCWLAACNPAAPRVVWIWDMTRMRLDTVVVQICAVHALEWHPGQAQLAVTTNSPCLYMWRPEVGLQGLNVNRYDLLVGKGQS